MSTLLLRLLRTGEWGLRKYIGNQEDIWGGDAAHNHIWGEALPPHHPGQVEQTKWATAVAAGAGGTAGGGCFCECGAWRGSYGLEPTPELYVQHTVEIFREVKRVLRKDGTVWINLGDSYSAHNGQRKTTDKAGEKQQTKRGSTECPSRSVDGLKPKDLVGIPWMVAFALRADGWYLRSDMIWSKCLSGGARLYAKTQKGEMPATLKDLVRLNPSTVKLWDGTKWNQVVAWGDALPTPDRKRKALQRRSAKYRNKEILPVTGDIELEFLSGERVGCTREHRWPTQRGNIRADQIEVGDIVTTSGLPEPSNPVCPTQLSDTDSGWFVGMYLAEGSKSDGTLQFAGHIKEVERNKRLKTIAESFHGFCPVSQCSENGISAHVNGHIPEALVDTYIVGKSAKDKHLHSRCWGRSNAFLQAVLHGYLEGDGGKRQNGSWRLGYCNNDQLTSDLRTISARLGASVRLRRSVATNTTTGKRHKIWRGDLVFNSSDRRKPDGTVVAIRQSRARQFFNVSLEQEPHSFTLASGICSKNSNPMPESVTDRPTRAHEYIFLLAKSQRYFFDGTAVKEPFADERMGNPGVYRRTTSAAKGANNDRQDLGFLNGGGGWSKGQETGGRNIRSVWTINSQPYSGSHFATFPEKLVEPCVKAGTSEKGCCPKCGAPWRRKVERTGHVNKREPAHAPNNCPTKTDSTGWAPLTRPTDVWEPTCKCGADSTIPCTVLDPFGGSGTTARVATQLGRNAVLVDIAYHDGGESYLPLAIERIQAPVKQKRLAKVIPITGNTLFPDFPEETLG